MPNRIIKESITTSPEIDQLSDAAEAFFYRLTVTVDDHGRFDARSEQLITKCYTMRHRKMRDEKVNRLLAEVVDAGLVSVYEVGDRPYLQIVNWSRHQRVRATKSKFPGPSDGRPLTSADICGHPRAIDSEGDSRTSADIRGQMPPGIGSRSSKSKAKSSRARGGRKPPTPESNGQGRVAHEPPDPEDPGGGEVQIDELQAKIARLASKKAMPA